jgi:hypothetical protein
MRGLLVRLLGLAILLAGSGSFLAGRGEAQDMTQSYIVQYGDTLWDIAARHLGDPHRWRAIHQNNPYITNPNLIYPGDILMNLPGLPETQTTQPPTGAEQPAGPKQSSKRIARPWYGVPAPAPEEVELPKIPEPIVPSGDFIEAVGYIVPYAMKALKAKSFGQITGLENGEGETSARVVHSEYGQPGLVFGDSIYINKGMKHDLREGDMFLAFRPLREVRHPLTNELIGTQIAVLGRVRIKAVEPEVACAEIVKSYNYIEIGNPIMPVSELSVPMEQPQVGQSRSYGFKVGNQLIGHIIAERLGRISLSYGDIVFLDVGAAQGIQPADNFIVFREVGEGYPIQSIGRLTVLSVQKQTATALVTESAKPFEIGEKVVLRR